MPTRASRRRWSANELPNWDDKQHLLRKANVVKPYVRCRSMMPELCAVRNWIYVEYARTGPRLADGVRGQPSCEGLVESGGGNIQAGLPYPHSLPSSRGKSSGSPRSRRLERPENSAYDISPDA